MGDIESQVTGLLHDLATGAGSPGHIPRSVRQRILVRKMAAASMVAVAVIGIGFGIRFGIDNTLLRNNVSRAAGGSSSEPFQDTASYTDSKLGWSWRYPSNWHLQTFSGMISHGFLAGALIANVDRNFRHPDCGKGCSTSLWDMRDTPHDLVFIEFACLTAGPTLPNTKSKLDTAFPLSLADFTRSSFETSYGAPEPHLWMPLLIHGRGGWGVYVWLGQQVSASERQAASRIVSSITEPTGRCS